MGKLLFGFDGEDIEEGEEGGRGKVRVIYIYLDARMGWKGGYLLDWGFQGRWGKEGGFSLRFSLSRAILMRRGESEDRL